MEGVERNVNRLCADAWPLSLDSNPSEIAP
jgi:hypothetical protein